MRTEKVHENQILEEAEKHKLTVALKSERIEFITKWVNNHEMCKNNVNICAIENKACYTIMTFLSIPFISLLFNYIHIVKSVYTRDSQLNASREPRAPRENMFNYVITSSQYFCRVEQLIFGHVQFFMKTGIYLKLYRESFLERFWKHWEFGTFEIHFGVRSNRVIGKIYKSHFHSNSAADTEEE